MDRSQVLCEIIRSRRAVYPELYSARPIPKSLIWQMLENANWAPTHKRTEPWRFKVLTGAAKDELGAFLVKKYRETIAQETYKSSQVLRLQTRAQRAACIIVILMQRDGQDRLPEWEELASTAMAVQNLWLTAVSYGVGAYWSSPTSIQYMDEFIELKAGERCLGFFYMGYCDVDLAAGTRKPIDAKVEWIDRLNSPYSPTEKSD